MTLEDCLTIVEDESPVEIRHNELLAPIKGTSADLWRVLEEGWLNKEVEGIAANGGIVVLWLDSKKEEKNDD